MFILGIIGWLWVKYQAAERKSRQHDVVLSPGSRETHPTYDNPTADVGRPEGTKRSRDALRTLSANRSAENWPDK